MVAVHLCLCVCGSGIVGTRLWDDNQRAHYRTGRLRVERLVLAGDEFGEADEKGKHSDPTLGSAS
ncbi:MAG: hypothetical protein ABIH23_12995 [bacterium]